MNWKHFRCIGIYIEPKHYNIHHISVSKIIGINLNRFGSVCLLLLLLSSTSLFLFHWMPFDMRKYAWITSLYCQVQYPVPNHVRLNFHSTPLVTMMMTILRNNSTCTHVNIRHLSVTCSIIVLRDSMAMPKTILINSFEWRKSAHSRIEMKMHQNLLKFLGF